MFERKRYQHLAASDLVDDPANCKQYVGDHSAEARKQIGAWRWIGIQEHKLTLVQILSHKYVIDLGGSAGPFGYGSVVVDPEGELPCLYDAPPAADAIISSHTFEHIPDLSCLLLAIIGKLRPGGHLAVFVPSYRYKTLRADVWPYHCHTFCLLADEPDCRATPLDGLLMSAFDISTAVHTSDNCLFVAGSKRT